MKLPVIRFITEVYIALPGQVELGRTNTDPHGKSERLKCLF